MSASSKRKRREVIPVDLTGEQRYELERLWFYYGNHGHRATPGNHGFIQSLLESGEDQRPLQSRHTTPTPECAAAVDAILIGKMPAPPSKKRMADVRDAVIAQYEEDRHSKATR